MDLEVVRTLCMRLSGTEEEMKWDNDLCFMIERKMYCVAYTGTPLKVSLKVGDEAFEELCDQTGIIPAPYLARYKWVQVTDQARLSKKQWETLIIGSYELIHSTLTRPAARVAAPQRKARRRI